MDSPRRNLRRAREYLARAKARIDAGTFLFSEAFPDFSTGQRAPLPLSARTCSEIFDAFLGHETARVERGDLAPSTLAALKSARIGKKDRPKIDPFSIQDAEVLIAAIHRDWGEAQGNYDEFRFFTGLRPSEQIALVVSDYDAVNGVLGVTKARVADIDRDRTKIARHTSVSWNLMTGRNPLFVAQQHDTP